MLKRLSRTQIVILVIAMIYATLFFSARTIAQMSAIAPYNGALLAIHGECWYYVNYCSNSVMIPYRSYAEWNSSKPGSPGCIAKYDYGYSYCYGMGMGQDGAGN